MKPVMGSKDAPLLLLTVVIGFFTQGMHLRKPTWETSISLSTATQWEFISDSAKDLVQQMLSVDPKQRITIQEILNHRWLRDRDKALRIHLNDTIEEMKKYNNRRKLKTCVLNAVNSSKWYNYDETVADDFVCDFGDDEVTSTAVSTIMDRLDDIYCLQESQPQERPHLLALLEDTHLHSILEIFDQVVTRLPTPIKAPSNDAVQCLLYVLETIKESEHRRDVDRRDLHELKELLNRPHFKEQQMPDLLLPDLDKVAGTTLNCSNLYLWPLFDWHPVKSVLPYSQIYVKIIF